MGLAFECRQASGSGDETRTIEHVWAFAFCCGKTTWGFGSHSPLGTMRLRCVTSCPVHDARGG